MQFFVNLVSNAVTLGLRDSPLATGYPVAVKGGQDVPLVVQYHRDGTACPPPAGASGFFFTCKPVRSDGVGQYEGALLASVIGDEQWTIPATGTGTGLLINHAGGYDVGVTALAVDTGTGTILAGDTIQLGANVYPVAGALASGVVTIAAPGLLLAVADNSALTVLTNTGPATATLTLDSTPIRTALGIDSNATNDKDTIPQTVCELGYTAAGATRPWRSQTFSLQITNWVNQGDEAPIDAAPASPGANKVWSSNDVGALGYHDFPPLPTELIFLTPATNEAKLALTIGTGEGQDAPAGHTIIATITGEGNRVEKLLPGSNASSEADWIILRDTVNLIVARDTGLGDGSVLLRVNGSPTSIDNPVPVGWVYRDAVPVSIQTPEADGDPLDPTYYAVYASLVLTNGGPIFATILSGVAGTTFSMPFAPPRANPYTIQVYAANND